MSLALTINQATAGIIAAVLASIPSYFGLRLAFKVDKRTEQAGMATQETVTTGQVMQAFNDIAERLGDDNKQLRIQVDGLLTRLDTYRAEIYELRDKLEERDNIIAELRAEIASFLKRNGHA